MVELFNLKNFHTEKLFQPLNYSFYNLEANPFSGQVPNEHVDFIIEREDEVKNVIWALNSSLNGPSTHTIIVGGYGNGKTHLLKFLFSSLGKSTINDGEKILTTYINTPGKSFRSLYSSFIMNVGKEFLVNAAWSYVGLVCLNDLSILVNINDEEKENIKCKLEENPFNIKQLVEEGDLLLPIIIHRVKNKIANQVPLVDFTTAFLHLLLDDYWFLSWKWLCGESIPFTQRKELDLSMSIENDERALMAFLSIKKILQQLGYALIILLIDEFEVIEALAPREKQKILNELRHLIDLTPEGLCIVLSCAPEIWRTILSDYHAFTERFAIVSFLRPLNENHISDIISEYLKRSRLVDAIHSLYPFEENVIPLFLQLGMGNIRQTLKICQLIIDFGIQENISILDVNSVKKLISYSNLFNQGTIDNKEG